VNRTSNRGGFTLVEMLIVSVIVGILAGIATPSLTRAVDRAAAAKVAADARTITVAVRSFVETGGTLPASEAPGVGPSTLGPYLEANMTFTFRDTVYRFVTQPAIGGAQLWVDYPVGSGVGNALQRFRNTGTVTWTPTRTTFVLAE